MKFQICVRFPRKTSKYLSNEGVKRFAMKVHFENDNSE